MDRMTKLFLGRILGEVYRLQRRQDPKMVPVDAATIYGLLKGFEWVVDETLEGFGEITDSDHTAMVEVLDRYFTDKGALKNLKGFYDIERELTEKGVDRVKAISLLTYLRTNHQFTEVIDVIEKGYSPSELKGLEPEDTEI